MTLASKLQKVVLVGESPHSRQLLEEFAQFWKVPYATDIQSGENSAIFTSQRDTAIATSQTGKVILAPLGVDEAEKLASEVGVSVKVENSLLTLPVGRETTVAIRTENYKFSGSNVEPLIASQGIPILSRIRRSGLHLLGLDLLTEYDKRLYGGVEETPNWRFSLVTKFPLSYRLIPSFIRNRAFRSQQGLSQLKEENLGPVEFLRTIFLASLVKCAGPVPRIAFWRRGKTYALSVTHDVETKTGLESGALGLLEVEEPLQIRATWNIPSSRYSLSPVALERLLRNGEIGAHDTKHDGRLAFLDTEAKTRRVASCMVGLRSVAGQAIRGFRAPLLQHGGHLTKALANAGYEYDSSCPAWEILSPTSLRPHGVGTIFPFFIDDILEVPVSLPQDHQLLRVVEQNPESTVDLLLELSKWIKGVGGACVLLTHPEYEFAMSQNQPEYKRLLEHFRSDPQCDIMTLREMSDWWKIRTQSRLEVQEDHVSVVSSRDSKVIPGLSAQLVTDYDDTGFKAVDIS
jgi:hypothetical protein